MRPLGVQRDASTGDCRGGAGRGRSGPCGSAARVRRSSVRSHGAREELSPERADDPKAQGTVKIVMQVGASGEVITASAQDLRDLPPPVVVCLLEAARRAQFDKPTGKTPVTLVAPLNFVVKD